MTETIVPIADTLGPSAACAGNGLQISRNESYYPKKDIKNIFAGYEATEVEVVALKGITATRIATVSV